MALMRSDSRTSSTAIFFALYATMYGAFGAMSPFWPRLFEIRGLTPEQLGVLLGAGTLMRLVCGPLLGRIADVLARLHAVLAVCMILSAVFAICLVVSRGFWALLLFHLAQAAALAPVTSVADALAIVGAARNGFRYGQLRGAASAAFVVGTLTAGFILVAGDISIVVSMHAALLAVGAVCVMLLRARTPRVLGSSRRVQVPAGRIRQLWDNATFRRMIIVSALVYGSHAAYDAFAIIRWNAAHISPAVAGVLWSEAVIAEIAMFVVIGPKIIGRLGTNGAAALAAAAGIVRWLVMGTTTATISIALVQPLHGFTFALLHLTCMRLMASIVPAGLAATSQVIYAAGGGVASAVLTVLSGHLYSEYGGLAFLTMALICALAMPIAWFGLLATERK